MICDWHQCSGCTSPVAAGDPTAAMHWAQALQADPAGPMRLRACALETGLLSAPARADDATVLRLAAAAIERGQWRVCGPKLPLQLLPLPALSTAGSPPPAAPARADRASAPPPAPRAVAAAPDPSPWDDVDESAMVDTLVRAARSGSPFCEICAKASAQRGRAGRA